MKKSERKGRIYNSTDDLFKIERQLDAIQQHSRIATQLIRAYISCSKGKNQIERETTE